MKTTRIIEITIDNELHGQVREEAKKRHISASAFIRMAIADYLDRLTEKKG